MNYIFKKNLFKNKYSHNKYCKIKKKYQIIFYSHNNRSNINSNNRFKYKNNSFNNNNNNSMIK